MLEYFVDVTCEGHPKILIWMKYIVNQVSYILGLELIGLSILLSGSAFFSAAETAFISLNKVRIWNLSSKGDKKAKTVLKLLENPDYLISTILVGNNLVNIAASAVATSVAIGVIGSEGVGIAIGIMTFLTLTFGEVKPKRFAIRNAEKYALLVSKPIRIAEIIFYPIVRALNFMTGGKESKDKLVVTEDEIKAAIELGRVDGSVEEDERKMAYGVFELDDTTVKNVMIAKEDMVCLDMGEDIDRAREIAIDSGFSRIPVFKGDIDNIIGILYAKDLISHKRRGRSLKKLVRSPYFVSETETISDLLKDLRRRRVHMAIVVDDAGKTTGLVTLEDLVEEIVGEISDEYD